jgi:TPR repeat protein
LADDPHLDGNMSDAGYIYALINPSLEGLVKVGMTTRDPPDRVRELSAATGVPTPFVLAYDIYVADCSAAEAYLHTLLERRGYRVSDNREFFSAPLKDVIKAMLQVEEANRGTPPPRRAAPPPRPRPTTTSGTEWSGLLEEAQAYYHGEGETLEDKREALKLFKQAAQLEAPDAYYALGVMHRDGEGCEPDVDQALEFFKAGVKLGSHECWAEMAMVYTGLDHLDNAAKCWTKYFRSDSFQEGRNGHEAAYGHAYLVDAIQRDLPVDHESVLAPYADDIVALATEAVRDADPDARPDLERQRRAMKKHLGAMRWFDWLSGR